MDWIPEVIKIYFPYQDVRKRFITWAQERNETQHIWIETHPSRNGILANCIGVQEINSAHRKNEWNPACTYIEVFPPIEEGNETFARNERTNGTNGMKFCHDGWKTLPWDRMEWLFYWRRPHPANENHGCSMVKEVECGPQSWNETHAYAGV